MFEMIERVIIDPKSVAAEATKALAIRQANGADEGAGQLKDTESGVARPNFQKRTRE